MILETEDERSAFDFICGLASEQIVNKEHNELKKPFDETFGHLKIRNSKGDGLTGIPRKIMFDFDVLFWLQQQVKK